MTDILIMFHFNFSFLFPAHTGLALISLLRSNEITSVLAGYSHIQQLILEYVKFQLLYISQNLNNMLLITEIGSSRKVASFNNMYRLTRTVDTPECVLVS